MGKAACAVFELEADVACAGGPADGGGVACHDSADGSRCVAGDGTGLCGGGNRSYALTLPVGAADGAHEEVVVHVGQQAVDGVAVGGAGGHGAGALVEALEAVLDNPALRQRVVVPVQRHAVGGDIVGVEACDIGADVGSKGDGVAPVADDVIRRAAERAHGSLIGGVGREASYGDGMAADSEDAVETAGVPHMKLPPIFDTCGHPVERGGSVADVGGCQAVGSEAGQAVGEYAVGSPLAEADAAGCAVLTHAEGVAGGGLQAGEGVGVARHVDVGGGPVGSGALLNVYLIVVAVACPGDGDRLVGVRNIGDDGSRAERCRAGEQLHDRTPRVDRLGA